LLGFSKLFMTTRCSTTTTGDDEAVRSNNPLDLSARAFGRRGLVMVLSMVRLVLVVLVVLLELACTKHITVVAHGHRLVAHVPVSGAVHPYPGLPPLERDAGTMVAVFFTTTSKLEPIAKTWADHLYYDLLPCSQRSHDFDLFSGTVFVATDEEQREIMGTELESGQGLYKVHVPLDLQLITRMAHVQGALDVPKYLDEARSSGLCIQIGGGQMWGVAVFSNLIPAPVAIRGDKLETVEVTPG
jgi:hypothetical protein